MCLILVCNAVLSITASFLIISSLLMTLAVEGTLNKNTNRKHSCHYGRETWFLYFNVVCSHVEHCETKHSDLNAHDFFTSNACYNNLFK